MISITLNKQISCEHICEQVQKIVTKFQNSNGTANLVLVIDVKEITQTTDDLIPKIEYKN